ncbi:MAG TPA: hypothetical protein VMM38_09135 [Aridibacter sp.]|nr:hypothetical protein [Aridibacter sp.]
MKALLEDKGIEFLVQEFVPGDENAIESDYAYIEDTGQIGGEFTGKKIPTYPKEFGQSCALTFSDADDVAQLGREVDSNLNFRGLPKFDFKRAPDGQLFLLEVSPRFSLLHHLGPRHALICRFSLIVTWQSFGARKWARQRSEPTSFECRMT